MTFQDLMNMAEEANRFAQGEVVVFEDIVDGVPSDVVAIRQHDDGMDYFTRIGHLPM